MAESGQIVEHMDPDDLAGQAHRVLDVIEGGGVAIIALDVAYGIIGHHEEAIRRIFKCKDRSYEKPSGFFSNWNLFNEIQIVEDWKRDIVHKILFDHGFPFSTVAPYRKDHPMMAGMPEFTRENSTKGGTLDMLMNAGPLHNALTRAAHERGIAVVGSSANTSLSGSKYRVDDIDPPVLAEADIVIDGGQSRYANDLGHSSTIIDFESFETIRVGVCYDQICYIFQRNFDIDLRGLNEAA